MLVVNVSDPHRRYVVDLAPAPMFPVPDSDRETATVLAPELNVVGSEPVDREHWAFVHALLVENVTLPPWALVLLIVAAASSSFLEPKLSAEADPAEMVQPAPTVNDMLTVAEADFCALDWGVNIRHKLSSATSAMGALVSFFMDLGWLVEIRNGRARHMRRRR